MSKLWYDRPAAIWNEALPLGSGNLGAMVYGGIDYELIKLNHDTLWSGTVRPEPQEFGKEFHDTVRRMIFEGRYAEADEYIQKNTKTVAAICNMLAQEKDGELLLLPAMPRELPNGEIRDLRISGQRTLSFRRKNGLVVEDSVKIRPCGKDR